MPSRSSVAASVREHKTAHPELYCRVPACLWRVKSSRGGPDTPCRKHPLPLPQVELPLTHDHAADEDCSDCRKQGHVPPSEEVRTPYPWCRGNPTREDCARAGYCRRDPNCGD